MFDVVLGFDANIATYRKLHPNFNST